uniref:claudin-1 isoform X2 n=1 Tax=Centroberyx gerrardi TaxID=166262 RepID=UPI003AAFFC45
MANAGIQLLGFVLAFLGFIGLIASTIMPEWKASSYAGDNIITAQAMYEGLWKTCVSQSTGQVQCKVYDSLLQLPGIVQGTRGLMVASILLCAISILVAVVGMRCTTCLADNTEQKDKVALAGGVVFIVSGMSLERPCLWDGEQPASPLSGEPSSAATAPAKSQGKLRTTRRPAPQASQAKTMCRTGDLQLHPAPSRLCLWDSVIFTRAISGHCVSYH